MASYKKDAARYLWFVVRSDGTISEGNEYRSDGMDSLKETKEHDANAKLVSRKKVDPAELAAFYKRNGVPINMLDKGFRDALRDAKKEAGGSWHKEVTSKYKIVG
jgi:hypothetical protein